MIQEVQLIDSHMFDLHNKINAVTDGGAAPEPPNYVTRLGDGLEEDDLDGLEEPAFEEGNLILF